MISETAPYEVEVNVKLTKVQPLHVTWLFVGFVNINVHMNRIILLLNTSVLEAEKLPKVLRTFFWKFQEQLTSMYNYFYDKFVPRKTKLVRNYNICPI